MAGNPLEDEQLREQVLKYLQESGRLDNKEDDDVEFIKTKIDRDDFFKLLFQRRKELEIEAAEHNLEVALVNALSTHEANLAEIGGVRTNRYLHRATGVLSLEPKIKKIGLAPQVLLEGDVLQLTKDEEKEDTKVNERLLDDSEWYLIVEDLVESLSKVTMAITEDLLENHNVEDKVYGYEENGLLVEYYKEVEVLSEDSEERNGSTLLSFSVKKKRPMGFSLPVEDDEIRIVQDPE